MSTTIMPDQAAALTRLLEDTEAVGCEVADDTQWSLRVCTFHPSETEDGPPADGRWWTISVAGQVREIAPTPTVAEAA